MPNHSVTSYHYVVGIIGVYANTFHFLFLGPRTLCNACGLVWAKVVRFYVILLCVRFFQPFTDPLLS
jgi:hypothetical protein